MIKLKKIILIISGIIILSVSAYSVLDDPELRYFAGKMSGLKDMPDLSSKNFTIEEVVVGINSSTALTFVNDDILFLEKETGKIRQIKNGELLETSVWDFNVKKEGCECYTESGLLGITSYYSDVYVFVTEEFGNNEKTYENRIYKFSWEDNQLKNPKLVNILPADANMHHGGAMTVNSEGDVFAVIGDQEYEEKLENIENGNMNDVGIILKVGINENVKRPSLSEEPDDHYFGVGLRNSFGLTFDPVTNHLWISENGTHEFDEINLALPKYNSGWPQFLGPHNEIEISNFNGYSDYVYSNPEFSWERTVAPTGLSFVDENWDDYENSLFVGDCEGTLYRFQLSEDRQSLVFQNPDLQDLVLNESDSYDEIIFGKNFGCITDVEYHDGHLYVISYLNNGAIYKIKPN